ncbi:MAG TPA: pyridoxal-phosphate dependent enzyme [Fimbriimonadaceae bacterium]|jgi:1-aminocyclopropane-1-carboxylate deaminase/D-cysteine desulfhydrase-like pyridoxal-dependent ACC family enzyme
MPLPYDASVGAPTPLLKEESFHSPIENRKSKIENPSGGLGERFRGLENVADSQNTKRNTKDIPAPKIENSGNVLLDKLFGAELHPMPNGDWQVLYDAAEQLAQNLESEGLKVYRIPIGGSSPLGGYAFYEAAQEIAAQAPPFDYIITATSSGSTQAGLAAGLKQTKTKLIGIAADPEPDLIDDVLRVAHGLSEILKTKTPTEKDFDVRIEWAHPGYGIPSEKGNRAIETMARTEGILLDPIYTGKASAALLELAESGELEGRVLFWHTGGVPALFTH